MEKYIKIALNLAKRNLGNTGSNPAVGCVIVKDGIIVGRGWTGEGGTPHAEATALKQAGEKAKGADMFVTLEPCCHHGKTPPCTDKIIETGIKKVVLSTVDVDERVAGKGIATLKEAKIEVIAGVCQEEAQKINKGFFLSRTQNRPLVALKIATSLDGKIALSSGKSKWITNTKCRQYGHLLRSQHDAIMVGIGTVLRDDPSLDCRLDGLENHSPIRIVLDSNLKTPLNCKLVETAKDIPLWIFTHLNDKKKIKKLEDKNAEVFLFPSMIEGDLSSYYIQSEEVVPVPGFFHKIENSGINSFLTFLAKKGINRLFVEGGTKVTTSFIKSNLFDCIYWFRGSKIMGNDSKPSVEALDLKTINNIKNLKRLETKTFDNDIMEKLCQK